MRKRRTYMPNRIGDLRRSNGLTLRTLADMVGTTPSTLSKLERSEIRLSFDWAFKLAGPLGVEAADLAGPSLSNLRRPVAGLNIYNGKPLVDIKRFGSAVTDGTKLIFEILEHVEIPPEHFASVFVILTWHCLEAGYMEEAPDIEVLKHRVLNLLEAWRPAEVVRKAYGT
jgi:transcriptional regulator with XRE-family HTH domain